MGKLGCGAIGFRLEFRLVQNLNPVWVQRCHVAYGIIASWLVLLRSFEYCFQCWVLFWSLVCLLTCVEWLLMHKQHVGLSVRDT